MKSVEVEVDALSRLIQWTRRKAHTYTYVYAKACQVCSIDCRIKHRRRELNEAKEGVHHRRLILEHGEGISSIVESDDSERHAWLNEHVVEMKERMPVLGMYPLFLIDILICIACLFLMI